MQTAYPIVLSLHNITRWLVLVFGVLAVVRAFAGWLGKRENGPASRRAGMLFGGMLDLQLLLGLILYFALSPITLAALRDFGAAMKVADSRYFAIEHLVIMLAAVVLVHVGSAAAKKAKSVLAEQRTRAIYYTLALLCVIGGIPWYRPLLRLLGIEI